MCQNPENVEVGHYMEEGLPRKFTYGAVSSGSVSVHCKDHFWPFLQWSWESAMQI